MKYFSEELNKTFNTEKECLQAEKEFKQKKELEEKERASKLDKVSKRKKELADNIELANKKIKDAEIAYDRAKDKAAEILEKSNAEVEAILKEAQEKVKTAHDERFKAVTEFNKEFGVYKTTITNEQASKELEKVLDTINKPFKFLSLLDDYLSF